MQRKNQAYKKYWKKAKRFQQSTESVDAECMQSDVPRSPKRLVTLQLPEQQHVSEADCESSDSDDISETSSDENEPSTSHSPCLSDSLSQWTSEFQIKHNAVDSLLKILRKNGHRELPKTARTLLETCESVNLQVKSGMQYIYLDCKEQLLKHLKMYPQSVLSNLRELDISLNVDGLPLFKSSCLSLWPVLCKINLSPYSVFPFALCCGTSKPSDLEFLDNVVRDLCNLMENGLDFANEKIKVNLCCVTCDAPAKALVKSIKQYSGYYGCDKCTQKGLWDGHHVIYPDVSNLNLRTDRSFREKTPPFGRISILPTAY